MRETKNCHSSVKKNYANAELSKWAKSRARKITTAAAEMAHTNRIGL